MLDIDLHRIGMQKRPYFLILFTCRTHADSCLFLLACGTPCYRTVLLDMDFACCCTISITGACYDQPMEGRGGPGLYVEFACK